MIAFHHSLASALLVGAIVLGAGASSAPAAETVPQARPVTALLASVKDQDQKLFQTVFCKRLRAEFEKQGWEKVLRRYETAFDDAFGEYEVDDFAFEFSGDAEKGTVSVISRGKRFPGVMVVNEGGQWKVDER